MDINEGADWATSLAIEDGADHYLWDGDGVGAGLRRQTTEAFSGKKITATMFKGSESPFDEDAPYQPEHGLMKSYRVTTFVLLAMYSAISERNSITHWLTGCI